MILKIKIAAILLTTFAIFGQFLHIRTLNSEIETFHVQNSALNADIRERDLQIQMILEDSAKIEQKYKDILKAKDDAATALSVLQTKFDKVGRDWGLLLKAKPGLTEKIMTDATDDRWKCFEFVTGGDINADNGVCSGLIGE